MLLEDLDTVNVSLKSAFACSSVWLSSVLIQVGRIYDGVNEVTLEVLSGPRCSLRNGEDGTLDKPGEDRNNLELKFFSLSSLVRDSVR